jgi:hypothetical protein
MEKRGRPRGEIQSALVVFRIKPSERAALEIISKHECLSLSDAFRLAIREAAEKRNIPSMGLLDLWIESNKEGL